MNFYKDEAIGANFSLKRWVLGHFSNISLLSCKLDGGGLCGKLVVFDVSESGKEIGEKLFVLLNLEQQQELKQFIMDVDCGKIRIADILSCPFGSHIVCCLDKNVSKSMSEIQMGDLFFSLEQRLVMIQNKVIDLTAKEFDILALLIRHPKRVFTYEMITELVWEEEYASFSRKAVNNHVSNLRQKLKVSSDVPDYIKSVYGVGYKFDLD